MKRRNLLRNGLLLLLLLLAPPFIVSGFFMHPLPGLKVAHARHSAFWKAEAGAPVYYRDEVIVLMFHNISPKVGGDGTITPERFKADLRMLKQKGFNFITVQQFVSFLDRHAMIPPNALLLTFDDGYEGTCDYVLPVLKEEHAPALVFIIEGFMSKKQGMLTWPEVATLERSGLVTIGGHTYDQHYRIPGSGRIPLVPVTVTQIPNPETGKRETERDYYNRMYLDSVRAQQVLRAKLGHTTPFFAYPYGAYTPELVRILHTAGYRYLFTVIKGVNKRGQDPAHIYRINAGSPWVSPERLYVAIRCAVIGARFAPRPPATWIRS